MTFREIANKIDKTNNNVNYFEWYDIAEAVGLEYNGYTEYDRLQSYWIAPWNCTDTWVGFAMYFLDGEPVGYSCQTGRKSRTDYYWFSIDCADKVKKYIMSLIMADSNIVFQTDDIDRDCGNVYTLDYNDQVTDFQRGTYNGKKFTVQKVDRGILADTLRIMDDNGNVVQINVKDIQFGYCLAR